MQTNIFGLLGIATIWYEKIISFPSSTIEIIVTSLNYLFDHRLPDSSTQPEIGKWYGGISHQRWKDGGEIIFITWKGNRAREDKIIVSRLL